MKKTTLLLLMILIGLTTSAQELTYEDFKMGHFYIPSTEEMEKFTIVENDIISEFTSERDSTIEKYLVIREENTQVEWKNGIGNGNPQHEIIEWIDDCTYRLTYDSSKSELDEGKQWVNDNNGIVVSKVKIENNCMLYTATMTANDGQKISQDGIICKRDYTSKCVSRK